MVASEFLNSFVGKMTSKDKVFLNNLLNQDWDWVDDFIKVTGWIDSFGKRLVFDVIAEFLQIAIQLFRGLRWFKLED